jgi:5-(carboxyamino)imidazole ribonucleotide synthase
MIGILGGGQLSVFLVDAAHRLGLRVRVLVTDEREPAAKTADEATLDRPGADLRFFFQDLQLVLFESENIDLARFENLSFSLPRFVPSLETMRTLQDKAAQKRLLERLGLPTAQFRALASPATAKEIASLDSEFPDGWILKRARGGYDGKGNWLGRDHAEALAWATRVQGERIDESSVEVYAEARVPIARELALVAARNASGAFAAYPAIETVQTGGVCDTATGPASVLGLSEAAENRLREITRSIAEATGYVGTLAVEFFETPGGEILVNEIAPRVHNSGHFSIDAASHSQFELHLRAALELPLPDLETPAFFRMKNCLGPASVSLERLQAFPKTEPWGRVTFHDYGKVSVRPGRKLGHFTTSGLREERETCERELEAAHARWLRNLS